jgi:hypothetical protein
MQQLFGRRGMRHKRELEDRFPEASAFTVTDLEKHPKV